MKVNLVAFVTFGTGIVFVYSGVKGYDPRDVIRWGLGGKTPLTFKAKAKDAATAKVAPGQHPGDSPFTYPLDPNHLKSNAGDPNSTTPPVIVSV